MKVSVIIPIYNRLSLLPKTIESVLNQTYKADEIILVDDGSSEDVKSAINRYLDKVVYIEQKIMEYLMLEI